MYLSPDPTTASSAREQSRLSTSMRAYTSRSSVPDSPRAHCSRTISARQPSSTLRSSRTSNSSWQQRRREQALSRSHQAAAALAAAAATVTTTEAKSWVTNLNGRGRAALTRPVLRLSQNARYYGRKEKGSNKHDNQGDCGSPHRTGLGPRSSLLHGCQRPARILV